MENIQGKHFSITEQQGVNTVIYQLYKTNKEYLDKYPKYTLQRIESTSEFVGNLSKKTYYVEDPNPKGNALVLMSFAENRVVINSGVLVGNEVRVSKKPLQFSFNTYNPESLEYREFNYTPNMKRAITIIDLETTEEVKPKLFFDEKTNQVKGKCKLKPYKSYFSFELRDKS